MYKPLFLLTVRYFQAIHYKLLYLLPKFAEWFSLAVILVLECINFLKFGLRQNVYQSKSFKMIWAHK